MWVFPWSPHPMLWRWFLWLSGTLVSSHKNSPPLTTFPGLFLVQSQGQFSFTNLQLFLFVCFHSSYACITPYRYYYTILLFCTAFWNSQRSGAKYEKKLLFWNSQYEKNNGIKRFMVCGHYSYFSLKAFKSWSLFAFYVCKFPMVWPK